MPAKNNATGIGSSSRGDRVRSAAPFSLAGAEPFRSGVWPAAARTRARPLDQNLDGEHLDAEMPFTPAEFLDLFGAYNRTLWPAVAVLWVVTMALTVQLARGRADARVIVSLAAAQWAWSGGMYHALFFTRINPAAWLFAAVFLAQAALLIWYGVARGRLTLRARKIAAARGGRGAAGIFAVSTHF